MHLVHNQLEGYFESYTELEGYFERYTEDYLRVVVKLVFD